MRKVPFIEGEYYHIYNRGVDKRNIFCDLDDQSRFFQSMQEFNVSEPIGSIYEHSFVKKHQLGSSTPKSSLISFVAYCLNPNHYHFILSPLEEKGIQKFMHRLSTGYTNYFNEKYKRTGALFQGRYKSIHISTDNYLLHLSAYVNLNDKVHQLGSSTPKLVKSSWEEYTSSISEAVCEKDIVLGQFKNKETYKEHALESLKGMLVRKEEEKELAGLFLE